MEFEHGALDPGSPAVLSHSPEGIAESGPDWFELALN